MGAYVLGALGCALAPSMGMLIVWRIVQGAAMGAAIMCARAVVRDLYEPVEGARVMSQGLTGLGVLACLSAPVGGLLSEWFGWRAALFAVAMLALHDARLRERLDAFRAEQTAAARAMTLPPPGEGA